MSQIAYVELLLPGNKMFKDRTETQVRQFRKLAPTLYKSFFKGIQETIRRH